MFQVSEVSKWQNNRRSIEPVKRKFSNFLTLPTSHLFPADPSKSGQDHFDLSSDEEDTSEKNRSQPVQAPVFGVPAISTPADDEETFFRSRLAETENRKYSTSTVLSDVESTLTERKDSIVVVRCLSLTHSESSAVQLVFKRKRETHLFSFFPFFLLY